MPEPMGHGAGGAAGTLPLQARIGLLGYITSTSLDEDYAHVHGKREAAARLAAASGGASSGASGDSSTSQRPGIVAIIAFGLFGLLVATAGIQTARNEGVAESSRASLVDQVNDGRTLLDRRRDTLADVQDEVARAQRTHTSAQTRLSAAQMAYQEMAVATGAVAVTGPGLRLRVNDAPHPADDTQIVLDKDLRDIVNALWYAGAEAVSVGGKRITTTSAIRITGRQILVNYEDVRPPYEILAIGDPQKLEEGFNASTTGQTWLANKSAYGLRFSISHRDEVAIPAASSARLQLRYAENPDTEEDE